ncbi:MAG: permease-like cell division protein FtsX [Actinomycetes bacterium]|jgi:hypothetical protein|nr:MAG: hypothetical protein DIU60_05545 [Actinomycetota bacterium]
MNEKVEARLRAALREAAETVDPAAVRPLLPPEPWVPARPPRHRRPVLAAAAAAAAVSAVAGGVLFARSAAPPAPEPPADESVALPYGTPLAEPGSGAAADVVVFLCHRGALAPACRDGKRPDEPARPATRREIDDVYRVLRARTEITAITFEDQETALENFRRRYRDNKLLTELTKAEDLPESFRIALAPGADPKPVIEAAEALPGVAQAVDLRCLERAKAREEAAEAAEARRAGRTPAPLDC